MRITAVETILLGCEFPPEQVQTWNGGAIRGWNAAFLRIHAAGGLHGLGEVYFGAYVPEMIPPAVESLAPHLVGEDPLNIGYLWRKLNGITKFWNRHGFGQSVLGGIDIALHDLAGKALHVPVYQLLGGLCRPSVGTYASGGCSPQRDALLNELRAARDAEFRAFKWRLVRPQDAEPLMRDLRREAGQDFEIMVDLVQGSAPQPWPAARVLEVARALEPYRPAFLEEPFPIEDKRAYRELRARVGCPIAGGEGVSSVEEARAFLCERAVDVLQPDTTIAGGLTLCRSIAELAAAEHVQVAMHSWGGAVSLMANLHLALASPAAAWTEYSRVPSPFREALLAEPLRLAEGAIVAPKTEGLGVTLSDDVIQRYRYRGSMGHHFQWREAEASAAEVSGGNA